MIVLRNLGILGALGFGGTCPFSSQNSQDSQSSQANVGFMSGARIRASALSSFISHHSSFDSFVGARPLRARGRPARTDRVQPRRPSSVVYAPREPASFFVGPLGRLGPVLPQASVHGFQPRFILIVLIVLLYRACSRNGGLQTRQRPFIFHLSSLIIIFRRSGKL